MNRVVFLLKRGPKVAFGGLRTVRSGAKGSRWLITVHGTPWSALARWVGWTGTRNGWIGLMYAVRTDRGPRKAAMRTPCHGPARRLNVGKAKPCGVIATGLREYQDRRPSPPLRVVPTSQRRGSLAPCKCPWPMRKGRWPPCPRSGCSVPPYQAWTPLPLCAARHMAC